MKKDYETPIVSIDQFDNEVTLGASTTVNWPNGGQDYNWIEGEEEA